MNVETALKPLLDLASIILFEACSTENSKWKGGRLIRAIDLKVLQAGKFTSALLSEKLIIFFIILSKGRRGCMPAETFVRIWKFIARRNICVPPACVKPPLR
jgi:hypothetical protein